MSGGRIVARRRMGLGASSSVLACVLAGVLPAAAYAQDTQSADTITVTARLRQEPAQSVPISLAVIPGDQMPTLSAATTADAGLGRAAPDIAFVDGGGQNGNVFNIRGVGSFAPLSPDDTSVVLYTNGVPRSVYGAAPTLMDIDRVEILRGPQGTLYGRNTQGGAINVIPNLPKQTPEYSITSEGGSDGYAMAELMANQPLTHNLSGRLALRYSSNGGDVPNLVSGKDDGGALAEGARGTLLWTPGDRTSVTLIGFADKQRTAAPRFIWLQNPAFPQAEVAPRNVTEWRDAGASLRIEHRFDGMMLTSLTSFQDARSAQSFDLTDGLIYAALTQLPASAFNTPYADFANIHFTERTVQQEIHLTSLPSAPVAWTAGVNYFHSAFVNDTVATASPAAFNFQTQNGRQANHIDTSSVSVFGEATAPLIGKLKGTLGLRYTHESKDADYLFVGNGNAAVVPRYVYKDDLSDDFVTGRASLSYDWSDRLMTYATISRGYVSGGFAGVSVNTPTGKPETPFAASPSWSYEVGFKSQWWGRRLTLNGSLFYNDVKNGHLIAFNPSASYFTPAILDYRTKGGEFQAEARVNPYVSLVGGLGYTDARLMNVPVGSATGAVSGNRVPNVSRWSGNAGLRFVVPAGPVGLPGTFDGSLVWQYVGNRAVDVKNSFPLPAYGLVNLRLGWKLNAFEFYGFAYNLFDKRYLVAGQAWGPTVSSVRIGQPRVAGAGVSVHF